jgi:hypothetical protein
VSSPRSREGSATAETSAPFTRKTSTPLPRSTAIPCASSPASISSRVTREGTPSAGTTTRTSCPCRASPSASTRLHLFAPPTAGA